LALTASNDTFDFTSLADNKVQGIDTVQIAGSNDTLTLGIDDVLHMPDGPNAAYQAIIAPAWLTVNGDATDTVQWTHDSRGTWQLAAAHMNLNGTSAGAYDIWVLQSGTHDLAALAVNSSMDLVLL